MGSVRIYEIPRCKMAASGCALFGEGPLERFSARFSARPRWATIGWTTACPCAPSIRAHEIEKTGSAVRRVIGRRCLLLERIARGKTAHALIVLRRGRVTASRACAAARYLAEVVCMSPKELMYIEDALGHEQFLQTQCHQAEQALSDPRLKELACQLGQQHQQLFQKLFQLI